MTTRRDFLQTTATLAGLVFVGCDLLAAAPARAEPPEGFAAPSPSLIEQLRSQHQRHDWLRVTMASTQLELRALRIDAEGLSGLTARGSDRWRLEAYSDPSSHGHIAWSSISRIDKRKTIPSAIVPK